MSNFSTPPLFLSSSRCRGTQDRIKKQRSTIERWKKENDHIRREISAIEGRQQAAESDAVLSSKLTELQAKVRAVRADVW